MHFSTCWIPASSGNAVVSVGDLDAMMMIHRRRAVLPQIYVNKDLATMLMTQHSAQALLFSCSACLLQDTSSEHGIKSVINMTASSESL